MSVGYAMNSSERDLCNDLYLQSNPEYATKYLAKMCEKDSAPIRPNVVISSLVCADSVNFADMAVYLADKYNLSLSPEAVVAVMYHKGSPEYSSAVLKECASADNKQSFKTIARHLVSTSEQELIAAMLSSSYSYKISPNWLNLGEFTDKIVKQPNAENLVLEALKSPVLPQEVRSKLEDYLVDRNALDEYATYALNEKLSTDSHHTVTFGTGRWYLNDKADIKKLEKLVKINEQKSDLSVLKTRLNEAKRNSATDKTQMSQVVNGFLANNFIKNRSNR